MDRNTLGKEMKTVPTYTATIYVGLRDAENGVVHNISRVETICQNYCDEVGLCVTVTPTRFIYTHGNEAGAIIGLINYPRFPLTRDEIKARARQIASVLKASLHQKRLSIVCSDKTTMLGKWQEWVLHS